MRVEPRWRGSVTAVITGVFTLVGGACGGGDDMHGTSGCATDSDCKGARVCEDSRCVDPTGGSPGSGAAGSMGAAGGPGGALPGGGPPDPGSGSMSAAGGSATPPLSPTCSTVALRLSTAGEKTNAAFCFGMAYRDNYRCTFDAANDATLCRGDTTAYAVLFSETASGTIGVVYDVSDQQEIGRLSQAATGEFEIDFTQLGLVGECTVVGDVATLCVRAVTD